MIWLKYLGKVWILLKKNYFIEKVSVDASPVVGDEDFAFIGVEFFEGGSESLSNDGEVLAPLEFRFVGGSVGEVDEEKSVVGGKFVFPVDPVPHEMVVGPALEEDEEGFAVRFSFSIVKKGLWFLGHEIKAKI